MKKILVICILYNPSPDILRKWSALCSHDDTDIVFCFVDNSTEMHKQNLPESCVYMNNGGNIGIAAAQNIGIKYALEQGFDYIIFFDQDSDVPFSYIGGMRYEYECIKEMESKIAILGPTLINKCNQQKYKEAGVMNNEGYCVVDSLISSGTLIETSMINEIGMMDSDLFIDAVDFEWCWRANSMGYKCIRTSRESINHKVGSNSVSVLGIPFIISAPLRYYYQYRNWLWLLRRPYVPLNYKIKNSVRKIVEIIIIPMLARNKKITFNNIIKGIKAGFSKGV